MVEPAADSGNEQTLLVIVTGLSGSGKSVALRTLEDLNFYCIDNLPAALMPSFAEQITGPQQGLYPRVAVGIDARNRPENLNRFSQVLAELRAADIDCEVVFLQADDETLLARFSETRRRHPLTAQGHSLADAIGRERELLEPLASQADLFIDTTDTTVHELRHRIFTRIGAHGEALSLLLESFAYKRGVPPDIDIAFDARCIPNPYWEPALRPLDGRDPPVAAFLEDQPEAEALYCDIRDFLERWLPEYEAEQRSYITVGIGCTGGRHRSVYLVERLARHFRERRGNVLLHHREM